MLVVKPLFFFFSILLLSGLTMVVLAGDAGLGENCDSDSDCENTPEDVEYYYCEPVGDNWYDGGYCSKFCLKDRECREAGMRCDSSSFCTFYKDVGDYCLGDNECKDGLFCNRGNSCSEYNLDIGEECFDHGSCESNWCYGFECWGDTCKPGICKEKLDNGENCVGIDESMPNDSVCKSDWCSDDNWVCKGPSKVDGHCRGKDSDCEGSLFCVNNECSDGSDGRACDRDSECQSGRCDVYFKENFVVFGKRCHSKKRLGEWCTEHSDCFSRVCAANYCSDGANDRLCWKNSECQSGRCDALFLEVKKCHPQKAKGEWCTENSDCIDDYCGWTRTCQ